MQLGLEAAVLRIERQRDRLPAPQFDIFVTQMDILRLNVPQVGGAGHGIAHVGKRS